MQKKQRGRTIEDDVAVALICINQCEHLENIMDLTMCVPHNIDCLVVLWPHLQLHTSH